MVQEFIDGVARNQETKLEEKKDLKNGENEENGKDGKNEENEKDEIDDKKSKSENLVKKPIISNI